MKLDIERYSIKIKPDNEIDVAFIEEVLGLKKNGDVAKCRREDVCRLNCIAYLEIKKDNNQ